MVRFDNLTLASPRADANSLIVSPSDESFPRSGTTRISRLTVPLISTIATSSNCSILLATTPDTKSLSARKSSPLFSFMVTLMKKAGISVALALNTLGREISGSNDILLSIFSFTSINAKSASCPCSKLSTREAFPSLDSVRISVK
ncbi:unknown [Bacteroides sp. CAG:1060]|nr:unknown [Bacteroides sp. CAG:1060]